MTDTITDRTVVPFGVAEATKEGLAAEDGQTHSALEQKPGAGDPVASAPDRGEEPQAENPQKPDSERPDAQQPLRLKDIQVGNTDGRGFKITRIYAVQSDEYAIYQAGEVMVHFADDQGKAQAQRKAMLPVSSARAEVNALAQGLACREISDRHGCGSDWATICGQRVLSTPPSFQRFVACCEGRFGRCGVLHRTGDPRQNGRPRHGSARQCD
jgi:hypothetical protein